MHNNDSCIVVKRRFRLTVSAWRSLSARIDHDRSRLTLHTVLSYWLTSAGHSLLFRLQNASQSDAMKAATPAAPVFVLGFWRSGTTLLHELLCSDPQFGFPSTYACMNPSHFLLTEGWAAGHKAERPTTRPMDSMSYSWASPQEDEFALLALGAPSPYEALLVPSLMRDPGSLVDLRRRTPAEQKRWTETFRFFLQLLTVQQGKTIVLKSPPHGFKLPLLLSLFPEARYVVIERNPYEVFASNLKLWRTLLDLYALESLSPEEIEQFVLASYRMHEEAITEGMSIAADRIVRVRYEDLATDPVGQMESLYGKLKLGNFDAVRGRMQDYLTGTASHTRNRFTLSPTQKARVEDSWGSLIEAKHYGWPVHYLALTN
jgi:hypothetical protein